MKKGILVVSFGTSHEDTRKKTINAITDDVKREFKDFEVRTAFTSSIVMKILEQRDKIYVDTVEEALSKMKREKFEEIVVQPLHVICGEEYNKLVSTVNHFRHSFSNIKVGNPLLTSIDDYKNVAKALVPELNESDEENAVVFMGHGTHHHANSAYACMDYVLKDMGFSNVHVGTVEGYPELNDVIGKLSKSETKNVKLLPLMLVAGDHAKNDMAGEEEDSWENVLKNEGYNVKSFVKGLGEMEEIRKIYMEHIKDTMN